MPYILNPNGEGSNYGSLLNVSYPYKYPIKMDLRPGSEQHGKILAFVMDAAQKSRDALSSRFQIWREIDQTMTAYIPISAKEQAVREADSTKPVSIVVPTTYATMDTILTYLVGVFMQSPIFRYEGRGPEDTVGAALLEGIIDFQTYKFKAGLALHTMLRDMIAYGFGGCTPVWTQKMGYRTTARSTGISGIFGQFVPTGYTKQREPVVLYEGNDLRNIDPYMCFPDPSVSISDVQRGRFNGWLCRESLYDLLEREDWDTNLFNVKYLQHIDGRSVLGIDESKRDPNYVRQDFDLGDSYKSYVDVIYLYAKIIPKRLGLGKYDRPETWLFAVAGDSVVIQAGPTNLDHDMIPVAYAASEYDGHSAVPMARLEMVHGMQKAIDFMYNSHIINIRKSLNNMFVVDPELVNINDLKTPSPGKIIRLRKKAWGKGIADAISQLRVEDITRGNLLDVGYISDMLEKAVGTPDLLQGVMRDTGDRRSATEFRETKGSALSRLERIAWVSSLQAMQDLALLYASQTQQFMSQETYVKITGRSEEVLRGIFQDQQYALVDPLSILINYDVIAGSAMLPTTGDAGQWAAMFQVISSNPELAGQFDIMRIFQYWARLTGAKNLEDFVKRVPMQAQVLPDEEVAAQAQAGNIIPMEEAFNEPA